MVVGSVSVLNQSGASDTRGSLSTVTDGPTRPNLNPEYQDKVTISPQAQVLNQIGEESQNRQQQLEQRQESSSEESEQVAGRDFVRVSSSLGQAASSFGLSEQQAIELYKEIDNII